MKHLDLNELDRLCAILSAQHRFRLVPGNQWAVDPVNRKIMFPREELLKMESDQAIGLIWRSVQHAISTQGDLDPYDVAVDAGLKVEEVFGQRLVHPKWVLRLVFAAERERVEAIARRESRNLGNTYLPIRWLGWRAVEEQPDRAKIEDVAATLIEGLANYWERVSVAAGSLAAGVLPVADLPTDMPWDAATIEKICAVPSLPSYDALLEHVEDLVLDIVRAQMSVYTEQEEHESGEDGDENEEATEPRPSPEESSEPCPASDKPSGAPTIPGEILEALFELFEALGSGRVAIDFFEGDPSADPEAAIHIYPTASPGSHEASDFVPLWSAVSRTNVTLTTPLRRTFLAHLAENEVGEMEGRQERGRLNPRRLMRPVAPRRPFQRRIAVSESSYAFGLILDQSGSMQASLEGQAFPEAFGEVPLHRWHLATRMGVALAEAITSLPNSQLAIVNYEDEVTVTKRCGDPLTLDVKQQVMTYCRPAGGNKDAEALQAAIKELARANAATKLLFHLTDGQFCSSRESVQRALMIAKKHDIDVVFLTLALSTEFVLRYVPPDRADEINDGNVAAVLAKHLKRVIKTRAA